MAVILHNKEISNDSRMIGKSSAKNSQIDKNEISNVSVIEDFDDVGAYKHASAESVVGESPYVAPVQDVETSRLESMLESEIEKSEELQIKLAKYESDIDNIKESAKQEGFNSGYKDGIDQAKNDIELENSKLTDRFNTMLQNISDKIESDISNVSEMIQHITMVSIYKVFGYELKDKNNVASIIKNVISSSVSKSNVVVRLSRDDYTLLQDSGIQLVNSDEYENIKVIPDDRVSLGGCILETEAGTLDGRLETQLTNLHSILLTAKDTFSE